MSGPSSSSHRSQQPPVPKPRVFPSEMSAIPMSPSRLESPMFKERVATLMQQGDFYAKRLDMERRRSHDLELCLLRIREVHLETKKRLCNLATAQSSSATAEVKSVRTLENRLDKVLTRYDEIRNANKKLREEIQSLRREKVQQQAIQEKLERETYAKQSEVAKVAAATQAAFDARDRANRQTDALRGQVADEDDDFEAGWQEKKMLLDQDRASIRDIPRLRTPKQSSPSKQPRSLGRLPPGEISGGVGSGGFSLLLSTPDIKVRDETLKNSWLLNEKESDLKRQSERLKVAEDGLLKIKKKTGVATAAELAQALLSAEEKNFSLFNLINDLNTEMESIEIENNELEQLIAACKGASSDELRAQLKQQLEDQIDKSKLKVSYFEQRQSESAEAMDAMKTGALNIYHKVGHSDEAFAQQLASHGVTEANMLKLLGVIEQRIGELVDIHNIATNAHVPTGGGITAAKPETAGDGAQGKGGKKQLHATTAASQQQPASVASLLRPLPPSADEFDNSDSEEAEDGMRPCKIAELQEKTAALVGRRKEKPARPPKK